MSVLSLATLGGGDTAFAVAVHLTFAGFKVTLCELPPSATPSGPCLTSATAGIDPGKAARTAKELGVAGMSKEELSRYVGGIRRPPRR